MENIFENISILQEQKFVLVDIGASGTPPTLWQEIAPFAYYIGFDPDSRELNELNSYNFAQFTMVKKVVTDDSSTKVNFFLTSYPYCSSMLQPDLNNCQEYSFTETFTVIDQVEFPATQLNKVIKDLNLPGIDWIKLDSQGKDLDLFLSIETKIRDRLLVIDIEPGIIPFYQGENVFDETHKVMLEQGFWLADIQLQNGGFPRIKQSTRQFLQDKFSSSKNLSIDFEKLPVSPTALEARYFRTIEHLQSVKAQLRDYVSLWGLAMVDKKLGFALDVAVHIVESYSSDSLGDLLLQKTLEQIAIYQNG